MAPLFSIVTVTLNCAEDAVRTAHSVLTQSCTDYEYFIKDGGSTDDTTARVAELGVRVVTMPDRGVYEAMNQALALCEGRYVCFMNAGDLLADSDVLATIGQQLAAHNYPLFCFGDAISLDGEEFPDTTVGTVSATARPIHYRSQLGRFYLYRRTICHQAWFVDRKLYLELGGFDLNLPISAAYEFQFRALLGAQVSYLRVPKVVVVYQGGGISSVNSPAKQRERALILKRYYGALERSFFQAGFASMHWVGKIMRPLIARWAPQPLRARFFGF